MGEPDPISSQSARSEKCPLCPESGPPGYIPKSNSTLPSPPPEDDGPDDYNWIACTLCDIWYHTVCVLMDQGKMRDSVPLEIRDEIDQHLQDQGVWTDWSKWVERWYCAECLTRSTHPKTNRPIHHQLIPTTNKAFARQLKASQEPQLVKRKSIKRSPESSTPKQSLPPKRARTQRESNEFTASPMRQPPQLEVMKGGPGELSIGGRPVYDGKMTGPLSPATSGEQGDRLEIPNTDPAAVPSPARTLPTDQPDGSNPDGPLRPKRQVAMNQPDYHALHHHIATPTKKWLDLINNPAAHNTVIQDAKPPRIPASLLTKQWLESTVPNTHAGGDGPGSPLTPVDGTAQEPFHYPPHLPPTLFYGENKEPMLIRPEDGGFEGLGGKLPPKDISYNDIARLVGPNVSVDVIDVATQQSSQWTLGKWAETISSRSDPSHTTSNTNTNAQAGPSKTFNVISLEITGTELAKQVSPPTLVREIDWVDNFWNFGKAGKVGMPDYKGGIPDGGVGGGMGGMGVGNGVKEDGKGKGKGRVPTQWPKVQLYCLMGMKGSWTDWHVDFAASSVYYTVLKGAKTFFFIHPTEKNLKAYAEWCSSFEKQQNTWLGDMCDQEVTKATLYAGDTMIIPAGYIHSVYTPLDSIVFGGNFLHSYDIPTQLRLRQIEIDTKVPQRFRFPHLDKLCWYTAHRYTSQLRDLRSYKPNTTPSGTCPPVVVLHGLLSLVGFLRGLADDLDNESGDVEERQRKFVWERVPREVVDDPGGMVRELEWRVKRELKRLGVGEEEEVVERVKVEGDGKKVGLATGERKKRSVIPMPVSRVSHFPTEPWTTTVRPVETTMKAIRKARPGDIDGKEEDAEETLTRRHEVRNRVKVVQGVGAVWEEQDVVVLQKRVVWRDGGKEGVSGGGSGENGRKEVILGEGIEEGVRANPSGGSVGVDEAMAVES